MLAKSLDVIDNEDWIAEFGEAIGQQIPFYQHLPEDKVSTPSSHSVISLLSQNKYCSLSGFKKNIYINW